MPYKPKKAVKKKAVVDLEEVEEEEEDNDEEVTEEEDDSEDETEDKPLSTVPEPQMVTVVRELPTQPFTHFTNTEGKTVKIETIEDAMSAMRNQLILLSNEINNISQLLSEG